MGARWYNLIDSKRKLTQAEVQAIESVLNKDSRVEVVPTKNGVKILEVRREQVNIEPSSKR